MCAERRDQEAAAPAYRGNDARLARTRALEPATPRRSRKAEHHEEERVHPAETELAPVAVRRNERAQSCRSLLDKRHRASRAVREDLRSIRARQCPLERLPEYGESVGHADAEVYAQRGGRNQPAVEPRLRDDALPVEEPRAIDRPVLNRRTRIRHRAFPLVGRQCYTGPKVAAERLFWLRPPLKG